MTDSPLQDLTIGFIGAGNMATSIICGLVSSGLSADKIFVSNPSPDKLNALAKRFETLNTSRDNQWVAKQADVLVIAVKPQKIAQACAGFTTLDWDNKCVISVAAGVTCNSLQQLTRPQVAIIRSMPNTPATIGYGATGLFANTYARQIDKGIAEAVFNCVGSSIWVEKESLMDVITAISGSGPAHYFLYLESVIEAAIRHGLDPDIARQLATQTALGAAALAQQNTNIEIQQLRHNVTSPGGTTAAAVEVLIEKALPQTIADAITASVNRGQQLAKIAESDLNAQLKSTKSS
ncbi:MAG: pyrroline-5-carboxylate reductase [Kangiellaceae bacterium]|nr:pyrroline-5-carboxylate reductase [Kangiellaceae bacterium]